MPQGEGTGLSARIVDDAAPGPPCAGTWTGGGARVPRQAGPGHSMQDTQRAGGVYREVKIIKETAAASKNAWALLMDCFMLAHFAMRFLFEAKVFAAIAGLPPT